MSTGEIVGGVFLSRDQLLWMKQLAVYARAHFVNDCGLQVKEDCARDMLSSPSLAKKGIEGIISDSNGLVGWHLTIRLDAMLQAVQLPAGVTDLDTGLTDVDGNALSHDDNSQGIVRYEVERDSGKRPRKERVEDALSRQ